MHEYSEKDHTNLPTACFVSENSSNDIATDYRTTRNSYDPGENIQKKNFFHLTDTNSKSYEDLQEQSFSNKLKAFNSKNPNQQDINHTVRPFDDFLKPIFLLKDDDFYNLFEYYHPFVTYNTKTFTRKFNYNIESDNRSKSAYDLLYNSNKNVYGKNQNLTYSELLQNVYKMVKKRILFIEKQIKECKIEPSDLLREKIFKVLGFKKKWLGLPDKQRFLLLKRAIFNSDTNTKKKESMQLGVNAVKKSLTIQTNQTNSTRTNHDNFIECIVKPNLAHSELVSKSLRISEKNSIKTSSFQKEHNNEAKSHVTKVFKIDLTNYIRNDKEKLGKMKEIEEYVEMLKKKIHSKMSKTVRNKLAL